MTKEGNSLADELNADKPLSSRHRTGFKTFFQLN
jgi:hypothetical protein